MNNFKQQGIFEDINHHLKEALNLAKKNNIRFLVDNTDNLSGDINSVSMVYHHGNKREKPYVSVQWIQNNEDLGGR